MTGKNLHDRPFDSSTLVKLELFQSYCRSWLPVFIYLNFKEICIFDFFAGPGYDINREEGSPIRILNTIEEYLPVIREKKCKIKVFFNDFAPDKIDLLNKNLYNYFLSKTELIKTVEVKVLNENFESLFEKYLDTIKKNPSLIFIDQNGIKFFSKDYIRKLENTERTDFIYFISSSYIRRFGSEEAFNKYLSIDINLLKGTPYKLIHSNIINQVKTSLPENSRLKLIPFSIKKDANIYGIVLGTKHWRAVEKFLDIAWDINPINGEANFDINNDIELDLFIKTKLELFESSLTKLISEKQTVTNKEIYIFTLEQGHKIKHATDCLRKLKENKKIFYSGRPRVNYNSIYNQNIKVYFNWIKNETNKN